MMKFINLSNEVTKTIRVMLHNKTKFLSAIAVNIFSYFTSISKIQMIQLYQEVYLTEAPYHKRILKFFSVNRQYIFVIILFTVAIVHLDYTKCCNNQSSFIKKDYVNFSF